ncbi:MAG: SpoIIE family protein phosphatase, partial [Candidatus Aquicultor sp.]
ELVEGIASQAAVAIENARLYEQQKKAAELDEALNDINTIMGATLNADEIMQRVVVSAAKAIGVELVSITVPEGNEWTIKYRYPKEFIGQRFNNEDIPHLVLAAETRAPVVINDAYNDPKINPEVMHKYGSRSNLVIPLIINEETVGLLTFASHPDTVVFSNNQIDFATKLGASISLALENAFLHQQTEKELSRTKLLQDVAIAATTSVDLHTISEEILKSLNRNLGLKAGDIKLYNKQKQTLKSLAIFGYSQAIRDLVREIPVEKSSLMTVRPIRERRMFTHNDEELTPERIEVLKEAGVYDARYVVLPVEYRNEVVGTLSVSFEGRRDFTQAELDLFHSMAHIVGQAIENSRLYESQHHIADTLQSSLLTLPEHIDGIEFGSLYRSATEAAKIGGDFFDIFELGRGKIGIFIGDVSGKGIEATALTTVVKNTIKAHAYENSTPAMVMSKTNDLVHRVSPSGNFVSVTFFVLDIATGKLTYCNAGHPPALIKRASGNVELLTKYSPVIGAFPAMDYRSHKEILRKDDILLLYTDGITEARCGSEFYEEDRLVKFIANLTAPAAKDVPSELFDDVLRCAGGKLTDDVAVLAISLGSEESD